MSHARQPPHVSALTVDFWDHARRHVLARPVCARCGRSFFVPQIACPHCLSEEWDYQPSSGRGTVHSFTVVHRAPREGFDTPYVVADVELEEGWNMMSNIVGCEPDEGIIGEPVRVSWLDLDGGDTVLPVFALTRKDTP